MGQRVNGIRIVHYLNTFFAGFGGEESNDMGPRVEVGSRGPGQLIDKLLGYSGEVVATLICGDNFFMGNESEVHQFLERTAKEYRSNLIVAGPAFSAGRYGLGCGSVCQFANENLDLPAVTAMSIENPGAEFRKKKVFILPTGISVKSMPEVIPRLVQFGMKLAEKTPIGPAETEGYLPRGIRFNERIGKTSAQRSVDMVLLKLRGEPYQTEIKLEEQERVTPPAPLGTFGEAVVAIVTETGFVPHGNPDRIASAYANVWGRYSIADIDSLSPDKFMYIHGGHNTKCANQDPNRSVPVDALRVMERKGQIKQLIDEVFSTCGNGGKLAVMQRIGEEMAEELKRKGATAVILTST